MRGAVLKVGVDEYPALRELPVPAPGPGEVLVKVEVCGLNRSDLHRRDGRMEVAEAGRIVVGSEVAGKVAEIGPGVAGIERGARVFCDSNRACGQCRECRSGLRNLCTATRISGINVDGGLADYMAVPSDAVIPLPPAVSAEAAAALGLAGATAWRMLVERAALAEGEAALVVSASGAVGSVAVQIAKLLGAYVIATTGSKHKERALYELGADLVINHYLEPLRKEVLRATRGRGANVVIEHVGGRSFERALSCVARRGRIVTCGATEGALATIDIWKLFAKEVAIFGSIGGTRTNFEALFGAVAQGSILPVIADVFPLEKVADAFRALESRDRVGKVLVRVTDDGG